jgi:hypothetical protein
MSDQRTPSFDWTLWLQWLMANTLGWVLGGILLAEFALSVVGVVIGILQWVVLRQHIRRAGWWILATAGGWAAGWAIVIAVVPPEVGIPIGTVLGAAIGTTQWLILQRQLYRAGWWVVVSTLAWTMALEGLTGELLVGAVVGAATGIALELLLRYPGLMKAP